LIEHGDPRLPQRYWDKSIPGAGHECWVWTGAIKKTPNGGRGYASYSHEKRIRVLTQVLAEVFIDGYDKTKHRAYLTCDDYACSNPNHIAVKDRRECKNGHIRPEGQKQCPECRRISDRVRRNGKSRPKNTRKKPNGSSVTVDTSVFGDKVPVNVWRPTGWPQEVLGGRL
jgi:hypothetical protein